MDHYFIYNPNEKHKLRNIEFSLLGKNINLTTDSGVFSNKEIDKGTYIFIKFLVNLNLKGKVLDLGAGYGAIGISLLLFNKDINVDFSDVNQKCIELVEKNLKNYDLNGNYFLSDGYTNIYGSYDFILFNPPISIGKEKIYQIYSDTKKHLNHNGKFYLVIRKDKGALSHMQYLSSLFSKVSVIYKEKGYFVVECL